MKAYLDQGNTQVKLWLPESREKHALANDSDWRQTLSSLIQTYHLKDFVIASVAGQEKLSELTGFLSVFGVVEVITTNSELGWSVQSCYEDVSKLGVDRLLAMEAAYRQVQGLVVVVDCGSAVTIDIVSEQGQHCGGYIVPGYRLQQRSLKKDTSLKFVEVSTSLELGKNTDQCINFGIVRMIYSLCESVIREYDNPSVYLTGGDIGGVLMPLSDLGIVKPDLVFEGMTYLK